MRTLRDFSLLTNLPLPPSEHWCCNRAQRPPFNPGRASGEIKHLWIRGRDRKGGFVLPRRRFCFIVLFGPNSEENVLTPKRSALKWRCRWRSLFIETTSSVWSGHTHTLLSCFWSLSSLDIFVFLQQIQVRLPQSSQISMYNYIFKLSIVFF